MDTTSRGYDGNWISPESLGQNDTYLGNRLQYNRSDQTEVTLFDTIVGAEAKAILRRIFLGLLVLLVVILVGALLTGFSVGSRRSSNPMLSWVPTVMFVWVLINLLGVRRTVLGDWNMLLHKKADLADTAYGVVYRSLKVDHQLPESIGVHVIRQHSGPPVRGVRNMLQIRLNKYSVNVSVFAFGADLYVGWTLWRSQLAATLVLRWIVSRFADPGLAGMVEVEPVKALRDVVHDGLRTGIDAAMLGRQIPLSETFGGNPAVSGQEEALVRWFTVTEDVPVYSPQDGGQTGMALRGQFYQVMNEADGLITIMDVSGNVAVLRDTTKVRWA
ncbi:MAG TPA: hypothetical protein VM677_10485 [Actinokineospora sp.]|jgi:hypothetical protein|nr:hypothetical protein [Actinokineospora sp.]